MYASTPEQIAERKAKKAAIIARAKAMQEAGSKHDIALSLTGRSYSQVNQYLIAAQNGPAGLYGGFVGWKAQGRQVKKGGHGVIVYAPITKKDDDGSSEVVNMTTAYIFHVDQTEAI